MSELFRQRHFLAGTLGVSPDISTDELHAAYKDLAKIHHPDLGGDPDFMMVLSQAYDELVDLLQHEQRQQALDNGVGWDWNDEPEPGSRFGLVADSAGALVSVVLLPAAAIGLLFVAWWFIAAIS